MSYSALLLLKHRMSSNSGQTLYDLIVLHILQSSRLMTLVHLNVTSGRSPSLLDSLLPTTICVLVLLVLLHILQKIT